jgi:hypothetical protein
MLRGGRAGRACPRRRGHGTRNDRVQEVVSLVVLLVGLTTSADAELLYFVEGGKVQAPASVEGDRVRIETPDGAYVFPKGAFRKIVPGYWPEREWPERRDAARSKGAEERFAAAWWALENGLTPEAETMLSAALDADAGHRASARMVAALDRLAGDCPDPDLDVIRSAIGGTFEVARGPHILLLHQHPEARARVEMLERVLTTFYMMFAAQGIDLPRPRHRLVSVWFARRADYLAYLHSEDADEFRTTNGYYQPTRRLVLTFDSRGTDTDRGTREALRARLLFDLDRRAVDDGTAAHELIHQLIETTGLAPRHANFPIWLHEGLAMQFEIIRGGRWAGVGRSHGTRLTRWRAIQPPPRLAPLVRDTGFGHGYQPDVYAQAWALVYYLRKERPREFHDYLDLLRAPDPGPDTGRWALDNFRKAFGDDLDAIQAAWHDYMRNIQTPLEAEDIGAGR